MKNPIELLSPAERDLLNKSIAWHVRAHRGVILEGLASVSPTLRFDGKSILELGALPRSSISPFLVARGAADATVTCYPQEEVPKLDDSITQVCARHGLPRDRFTVQQADMMALNLPARFDLVLFKGVLGAINRQHDQIGFRKAMAQCVSVLKPGGHVMVVDKAHSLGIIHYILTNYGGAGRNGSHYFTPEEIKLLVPQGAEQTGFSAYGVVSFGYFGEKLLQKVADFLDENIVEHLVPPHKRAVFSMTCMKKKA